MSTEIVILIIFAVSGVFAFIWVVKLIGEIKNAKQDDQSNLIMQNQMEALRTQVSDSIANNTKEMNQRLTSINDQLLNSQKTVGERLEILGDVNKNIGQLQEATKRVFEVGQDIASLQEILRAPKLRGIIGELFLGDFLSQILPPKFYTLQYAFKSGEKVDAVIHLGQGLVPVDAKFSLENFEKMLKANEEKDKKTARREFVKNIRNHINDIANKYILPDEGTFDFALMYIPAENVYYETIIKSEDDSEETISSFARQKRVIPVSPNSFIAYLQTIVFGLRGMKIEQQAKVILEHLSRLKIDLEKFGADFQLVGKHLSDAQKKFIDAEKKLDRFEEKISSLKEGTPELVEKEKDLLT